MSDQLGPAQIAAILVLAQRGIEELHSQRNTRRLLAEGAHEVGRDYYPVVAVTHLAWIAAIFLLVPADAAISVPLLVAYLPYRSSATGSSARSVAYWTHRIITVEGAPVVRARTIPLCPPPQLSG